MAGLAFGLSSCLKDDQHYVDFKNVGAIAQIPSSAFYGVVATQGLPIQSTPYSYTFDVSVASPNPPTEDVVITLGLMDQAALTAYDTAAHYQLLPASLYSVESLTTTVKAGTRLAPIVVRLNTGSDLVPDPSVYNDAQYVLPFVIKSASNNVAVSSNYGSKILILKIKNNYDGTYHSTGTFTHPVNGPRAINRDKTLSTIDLNTVETEFADLGGSGWLMWLRVNPDNSVTLIPKGSTNTGVIQEGVNTYDPATQTYTLNYKYAGSGGYRVVTESIKRK